MYSITLLNKDNYEFIQEKTFGVSLKLNSTINKDNNNLMNSQNGIIDFIKDIDSLSTSDFFTFKMDNRNFIYRKSKDSKLSIILQSDKRFKPCDLEDISRVMLGMLEKKYFSDSINKAIIIESNIKELLFASMEELTVNFLELLRKNKLYAKFVYYNYNPSFSNAFTYKKIKNESASLILYNQKHENDKLNDYKDTILQKSTIKEKELCIELDKKSFPALDKRVYIKKYNDIKPEIFKKKNLSKYYASNSFIDKYVSLIYYLFL